MQKVQWCTHGKTRETEGLSYFPTPFCQSLPNLINKYVWFQWNCGFSRSRTEWAIDSFLLPELFGTSDGFPQSRLSHREMGHWGRHVIAEASQSDMCYETRAALMRKPFWLRLCWRRSCYFSNRRLRNWRSRSFSPNVVNFVRPLTRLS